MTSRIPTRWEKIGKGRLADGGAQGDSLCGTLAGVMKRLDIESRCCRISDEDMAETTPRRTCAVVGNSGVLLQSRRGPGSARGRDQNQCSLTVSNNTWDLGRRLFDQQGKRR